MAKPKGSPKTGGRARGTPNKVTRDLKGAILEAARLAGDAISSEPGGMVGYLTAQATLNPGPFLGLIGKVLPLTLAGEGQDGALVIEVRRFSGDDEPGVINAVSVPVVVKPDGS